MTTDVVDVDVVEGSKVVEGRVVEGRVVELDGVVNIILDVVELGIEELKEELRDELKVEVTTMEELEIEVDMISDV